VSQRYGSGYSHHQPEMVRKPLISTVLLLLYDFLSVKNSVNVPLEGQQRKDQDPDSLSEVRILGSGSVPKCHGSGAQVKIKT
jgi:hypothetical protein